MFFIISPYIALVPLSHTYSTGQSVDTFRWRVYRVRLLKELSMWRAFLQSRLTLVVKSDGACVKLDEGKNIIAKKEVVARCLKGVKYG